MVSRAGILPRVPRLLLLLFLTACAARPATFTPGTLLTLVPDASVGCGDGCFLGTRLSPEEIAANAQALGADFTLRDVAGTRFIEDGAGQAFVVDSPLAAVFEGRRSVPVPVQSETSREPFWWPVADVEARAAADAMTPLGLYRLLNLSYDTPCTDDDGSGCFGFTPMNPSTVAARLSAVIGTPVAFDPRGDEWAFATEAVRVTMQESWSGWSVMIQRP